MIADYIQAALDVAHYEIIDNPEPYFGEVSALPGVYATGETLKEEPADTDGKHNKHRFREIRQNGSHKQFRHQLTEITIRYRYHRPTPSHCVSGRRGAKRSSPAEPGKTEPPQHAVSAARRQRIHAHTQPLRAAGDRYLGRTGSGGHQVELSLLPPGAGRGPV